MIFARHDFTENFFNAVGYRDEVMIDNILIDEIARLIVDDKKSVVEILRVNGVNVSYKDNPELIKNYLVREIENGNSNIVTFLSTRISRGQIDDTRLKDVASKFKSADGSKPKTKTGQILTDIATDKNVQENVATIIANGITNIFSKTNKSKETNEAQLSERLKANEMIVAQDKKKSKIFWIIGGLIVAGGVGYGIYYFIKKKNAAAATPILNTPTNVPGYTPVSQ